MELDKKSIHSFARKYRSANNKILLNYKQLKDDVNSRVMVIANQQEKSRTRLPHKETQMVSMYMKTFEVDNHRDASHDPVLAKGV